MGPGVVSESWRRRGRAAGCRRRPAAGFATPVASGRPLRNRQPSPRILLVAPPSTWSDYYERLQEEGELTLLCQVSHPSEMERYLALKPDAIIAHLDSEALVEARALADSQGLPLIVLSSGNARIEDLSLLGASGGAVLPVNSGSAEVATAVRAAMSGLVVLNPQVLASLNPTAVVEVEDRTLSGREREVLQLIAAGMPNKQIARALGISPHTAKFHVAGVLQKLGAASRTEAVSTGVRRGLVSL